MKKQPPKVSKATKSPSKAEVTSLAAKLYHEIYPRQNFFKVKLNSTTWDRFTAIAEKILTDKF